MALQKDLGPASGPRATALREAAEKLGIEGGFHPRFGDAPLFLTVMKARRTLRDIG